MLNIDASYDDDRGCGSTGTIIRDGSDGMIATTNTFISHLVDAPMTEAYALKGGIDTSSTHWRKPHDSSVRLYGGR
jgi:hypothetical protein